MSDVEGYAPPITGADVFWTDWSDFYWNFGGGWNVGSVFDLDLVEDWPLYLHEDADGTGYAVLDIGADAAALLQRVTYMLMIFDDDYEEYIILGEEFDLFCDWEDGVFYDNFRGVWGAIDDTFVFMEVVTITDDYILYEIPVIINGRRANLSVAYSFVDGDYYILTATPESGGGPSSKEFIMLIPGDELTLLMPVSWQDEYYEFDTITVTRDTRFHEKELPDATYGFCYVMTDYADYAYFSDFAIMQIEDGWIDISLL
jgi:hypothetical protein